ncbi:hypothetical protein BH11MYX3_BH11MYX3_19000 [soil metagenome]
MDELEPVETAEPAVEQTVPELFAELASEVGTLVRQELSLGAQEIASKAHAAARNVILVGVAALLGSVSLIVLAGALALALQSIIPIWVAALAIAAVIGGAGYALFRKASAELRAVDLLPHETFASLKGDGVWAKGEIDATREQISTTMTEVRRRLDPPPKKKRRSAPKSKPVTK